MSKGENGSQLSAYERQRLQRIKENEDFLRSLDLSQARSELQQLQKKVSVSKRGLPTKQSPPSVEHVRRVSLRLRNLSPGGESLPSKPSKEPLYASPEVKYREIGPVTMKCENDVSEAAHEQFVDALKGSSDVAPCTEKMTPFVTDERQYLKELAKLRLTDTRICKVTKHRIFSVAVHPTTSQLLVSAGDKWGGVGIWNIGSSLGHDGVCYYTPHTRPINAISFPSSPSSCNYLYTASYDGSVRCLDLVKEAFMEVYGNNPESDIGLSHMSLSSSSSWLLASCSNGQALLVDTRTEGKATGTWNLHGRKIKTIHINPQQEEIFCTACVDGKVFVWDVRQMKQKNPKCLFSLKFDKSVSSAYYSPLTGNHLLLTSLDDRLRVFQSDTPGSEPKLTLNVRHNNYVGRWLTPFRAVWDPKSDSHFVVGSMSHPRQVEVYSVHQPHPVAAFSDEHLASVCSINAFHPQLHVLAGANSSGRLHVWEQV